MLSNKPALVAVKIRNLVGARQNQGWRAQQRPCQWQDANGHHRSKNQKPGELRFQSDHRGAIGPVRPQRKSQLRQDERRDDKWQQPRCDILL